MKYDKVYYLENVLKLSLKQYNFFVLFYIKEKYDFLKKYLPLITFKFKLIRLKHNILSFFDYHHL
jgi:hypothetical protein